MKVNKDLTSFRLGKSSQLVRVIYTALFTVKSALQKGTEKVQVGETENLALLLVYEALMGQNQMTYFTCLSKTHQSGLRGEYVLVNLNMVKPLSVQLWNQLPGEIIKCSRCFQFQI